ncbi:DoxX family protein [Streptomyces sp. ODS28]|uniref:DoxX family protein n=1 Tax=Streptomyces sp. ODS28 TaxID=3136688 RepID=UPI0031ED6F9A
MSVDTRTSRTPGPSGARPGEPPGGPRGFFDDEPTLSSVKVPSDPAQVVVSHASFRVQLASPPTAAQGARTRAPVLGGSARTSRPDARPSGNPADTGQIPAAAGSAAAATAAAATAAGRRRPVVWSGRTADGASEGDPTALLSAVVAEEERDTGEAGASTQVLPRVEEERQAAPGTVVGPRDPDAAETTRPQPLLSGVRPARGAFDEPEHPGFPEREAYADPDARGAGAAAGTAAESDRRQAYYPMRRMNLGVVLLPLRIFLGFISIYAGMSKLCDPVYFDGGERGSMVTWLRSLEPWTIASPLRDFALQHPVGAGLTVAFLQVIVGVLTICGLWQRLAAGFGALLSVALLLTVSWSTVPAYDAPDFIYLAAWSPLIIAGAPVYSVDAHLAVEAWKKLGPRVALWDLRERVLKRGALIASVVVGLALLIGSLLGGAVRDSQQSTVPQRGEQPTNRLPGKHLPGSTEGNHERTNSGYGTAGVPGTQGRTNTRPSAGPSSAATSGAGREQQSSRPSQRPGQRETVQAPRQTAPPARQSAPGSGTSSQPSTGGSPADGQSSTGPSGDSGSSSSGGAQDGSGSDNGGSGGGLGGLLGGGN